MNISQNNTFVENELDSADFEAKKWADLHVKKTSWFQLILKPENELILKLWKWADFSCFWSQESELILADFEAKKPNWL